MHVPHYVAIQSHGTTGAEFDQIPVAELVERSNLLSAGTDQVWLSLPDLSLVQTLLRGWLKVLL